MKAWPARNSVLASFAFALLAGQMPAFGQAPSGSALNAPNALLAPSNSAQSDVSTADKYPDLKTVVTDLEIRKGKASASSEVQGKPTAGDLVTLTLHLEGAAAADAQGAGPLEGLAPKLQDKQQAEWGDARILWIKPYDAQSGTIKIGITSYKPGQIRVKPIPFGKDGKPLFKSEAKDVDFGKLEGDKSKDDIYEPVPVGYPLWVVVLLGVLALAFVLAGLWFTREWYRRRKARVEQLASAPRILTPPEEFEKARRDAEARGHLDRGVFKPHYFALSDAAKRFLGKAYQFDAEERTTRELLVDLERLGMRLELLDQWERIFDEMDVVKFTDQSPELETARSVSGRLGQLVTQSWVMSPAHREILKEQQLARAQAEKRRPGPKTKGAT